MQKYKILVVDDESTIVTMVAIILQAYGYDVITAFDGEEGLLKVKNEHPDLILLDIDMPGINGYDVCVMLKDNESTKKIPVVMLSGRDEHYVIAKAHRVEDYILKPFSIETLLTKVSRFLARQNG